MVRCDSCKEQLNKKDGLTCAGCKKKFHLQCVGVEEFEKRFIDVYQCFGCSEKNGPSKGMLKCCCVVSSLSSSYELLGC